MTPEVTVRSATPGDQPLLVGLMAGFRDDLGRARPASAEIEAGLVRLVGDPAVNIVVATAGERALGYALQRRHFSLWSEGEKAVLEDLFVVASARRRGVGRRLVEASLVAARRAGCRTVSLDVNERNEPANRLLRRLGFACARSAGSGGRQVRHDLRLAPAAEPVVRWGEWLVDGGRW